MPTEYRSSQVDTNDNTSSYGFLSLNISSYGWAIIPSKWANIKFFTYEQVSICTQHAYMHMVPFRVTVRPFICTAFPRDQQAGGLRGSRWYNDF